MEWRDKDSLPDLKGPYDQEFTKRRHDRHRDEDKDDPGRANWLPDERLRDTQHQKGRQRRIGECCFGAITRADMTRDNLPDGKQNCRQQRQQQRSLAIDPRG